MLGPLWRDKVSGMARRCLVSIGMALQGKVCGKLCQVRDMERPGKERPAWAMYGLPRFGKVRGATRHGKFVTGLAMPCLVWYDEERPEAIRGYVWFDVARQS